MEISLLILLSNISYLKLNGKHEILFAVMQNNINTMANNNEENKFPWYAIPLIIIFGIPLILYAGAWLVVLAIIIGICAILNKLFE
jgi:hypothetical protein